METVAVDFWDESTYDYTHIVYPVSNLCNRWLNPQRLNTFTDSTHGS